MTLRLEFLRGGVSADQIAYGTVGVTYGEADVTYGQEAQEPLTGVNYRLVPYPAEQVEPPHWQFRVGDSGAIFRARVVDIWDPTNVLDLDLVTSATLVLTKVSAGVAARDTFALTIGTTDDDLTCTFATDDLDAEGTFTVGAVITFDTGRRMSVNADDRSLFVIRAGKALLT